MEEINNRIQREICRNTIQELSDENLLDKYQTCESMKNQIIKLENILDKYTDESIKHTIINEYMLHLIPAGTKGVIRGNRFNKIVEEYINNIHLDSQRFEIKFESKHNNYSTTEIPDWYILDKYTNRILIGMNQLDLWNGGQQLNRGFKYLNSEITENKKILCVVCNEIVIKSEKNKTYKLFELGFKNDSLCYLNNLHNIISAYFQQRIKL
tara:strand:+ start:87 stop:719 length:633 start_codon:yes stop_codon:yes gene_type:complete